MSSWSTQEFYFQGRSNCADTQFFTNPIKNLKKKTWLGQTFFFWAMQLWALINEFYRASFVWVHPYVSTHTLNIQVTAVIDEKNINCNPHPITFLLRSPRTNLQQTHEVTIFTSKLVIFIFNEFFKRNGWIKRIGKRLPWWSSG